MRRKTNSTGTNNLIVTFRQVTILFSSRQRHHGTNAQHFLLVGSVDVMGHLGKIVNLGCIFSGCVRSIAL